MGTLGLPALVDSASDLARVVSEARTLRGRTAACVISVVQGKNRAALIAFMLFALVAIPGAVYLLSTRFVDVVLVRLGAIAAEVVAAIVAVKNVLQKALGQAKAGLAHIEDAKRQVDTLMAQKREEQNEREKELQKEIAALKAQEQESVSRLSAATARVAELEERIRSAKEGRSLARFLAERTRSEDYRKYLGLISTIRQDFDALGKRLTGAAGDGDQFRPVDRIVLYIDDLDRCPEDKVMEVLQAVHLLLAYPLFVVVVGVDPRWLLHSLRGTFKAFQAGDEPGISNGDVWQTTPQNYLEKIFQIPFSLRPMTQLGYATFIDALLSPKGGEAKSIAVTPQQPPQAVGQQAPVTPAEQPEPVAPPHREAEEPQPAFVIHEESLSIKAWEATFAERLFALIPTPRAAKRFSNVYRLLKAPVRRDRLPTFEGTPELMGEFQVPMLLLAILTGAPEEAGQIFPELWRMALAQGSPVDALLGSHAPFQSTEGLSILQEKIRPILSDANFPRGHKLFAEWIPRVSRFSFDVGRSVELTRYAPNVSTPA
ncbi:hypothetical protein SBA3_10008 [Candidatus Sulfopaludibacter sp. SbA3]|nr:hypothetical protein SBA3_10008 [Candidatus Sulfopaludibacter sp. SbA3]